MTKKVCFVARDDSVGHCRQEDLDCTNCDFVDKHQGNEEKFFNYYAWGDHFVKHIGDKPLVVKILSKSINNNFYLSEHEMMVPNNRWAEVDAEGHLHKWVIGENGDYRVYNAVESEYQGVWECVVCGEMLEPGYDKVKTTEAVPYNGWNGHVDIDAASYRKISQRIDAGKRPLVTIPIFGTAIVKDLQVYIPKDGSSAVYRIVVEGEKEVKKDG